MYRAAVRTLCLAALATFAASTVTAAPAPADLAGTWAGALEHGGEQQPFALHFEPDDSGRVALRLSMPVIHLDHVPMGRARFVANGDTIQIGPFRLVASGDGSLSGVMPAALVPVYEILFTLRKVDGFDVPARDSLTAPVATPVWTFDAGSALWAGPTFAGGRVYVGGQDGGVFALDARTGKQVWTFHAGGAIRTRPTVAGRDLYVPADDGFLYQLDAATGEQRWRVRIVDRPIERLPFDDPKSRYDRFGSDVVVAGGRLYVGTHDGRVLALDPKDGARVWAFQAGDAVLAAPAVGAGRVVFGSYDKHVYALDAATGRELWRRDTKGAVVSTPALHGDVAIVGNRAYDLLGLDVRTGEVRWKRYVWMSWVESSATLRDAVAYVGSSDAAAVFAVDAATGAKRWTADVQGWAWGQPAVTGSRVYTGTSSQVGYPAGHQGGVLALDRATGAVTWRYPAPTPASGPYGFPGSPALGDGLVFVGGLDGRLVALRQ
jgi:outer membrane protein assembly factor BamB